jgi:hypothetical protein
MKLQRKSKTTPEPPPAKPYTPRHGALHIPLDFEQAVDALLKTKPKKKPRDSSK